VLATTDLVGDNRSETFRQQFASGNLDPNLYKKIGMTATDGGYETEWMFDNKNSNQLKTVLAEYFKNVVIDGNTTTLQEYEKNLSNNPANKKAMITLPWGKVLDSATEDERERKAIVVALLNKNEFITVGGSGFQRQANGGYKQITAEEGGVEKNIEAEKGKTLPTYSVIQMLQKYGGRFGNVPNDFDVLALGLK